MLSLLSYIAHKLFHIRNELQEFRDLPENQKYKSYFEWK